MKEEKMSDTAWLDIHLTKESMNFLWDSINISVTEQKNAKEILAGNISKSYFIKDNKDAWFYETVLKELAEHAHYKDWNNCNITPPPIFKLHTLWVNYQKQHEFNPPHRHGGIYSFVVFMKIPTHWKEQHALPMSANSNSPVASDFQFLIGQGYKVVPHSISLSPEDEGRLLFFPSWLQHQVLPFYGTEEERITISGNISLVDLNISKEPVIFNDIYENKEMIIKMLEKNLDIAKKDMVKLMDEKEMLDSRKE